MSLAGRQSTFLWRPARLDRASCHDEGLAGLKIRPENSEKYSVIRVFFAFIFLALILPRTSVAQDCLQFEDRALCKTKNPANDSSIEKIRSLTQEINFEIADKNALLCKIGMKNDDGAEDLKELANWEASRLATHLQKLDALRESRKLVPGSETKEIERLEKIIKNSSLLSYSKEMENLSTEIKREKVWNPNQFTAGMNQKLNVAERNLEKNQFPEEILKEMSFAKNTPSRCNTNNSVLKTLSDSAKESSPRSYHFKKSLLQEFSSPVVSKAFQKCDSPEKQKSQKPLCQVSHAEKMNRTEAEYAEQVCVLKELMPQAGSQLNNVSLDIPSASGDLVTEGPGDRPTEEEAKSKKFRWNIVCPEDLSIGGIARGAAGAGASFLTHELAHETVSRVTGEKLDWNPKRGTWRCTNCQNNLKPIAMAGLASHAVSSEYIVQNQSHDSQFQKGWLFYNVFNTTAYFAKDWMARAGRVQGESYASGRVDKSGAGDLRAFTKKESYIMGTAMIGHQLFSAYRYVKNRQDYQCKKQW